MATTRALHPEDLLAHYRIVSPLAAGGMGEVYLAQDQTLERSVALKVLPPELVRDEERVRRFVREAKSASSLNHPNIVTIYEIGEGEVHGPTREAEPRRQGTSVHYISMELVAGETLTTKIHHDKTDLRTILGYLAQAAEGLAKAHAAGIVHRDLKPSNIMISRDGFTKILDFGLAKLTERGTADQEATMAATQIEEGTSAGTVVGTAGYMSPEQVQGKAVDHRSDIFSFGCLLYEAVTRRKPFAAESSIETMHKIIHDTPAPVEEANSKVPAEVRRLIRRCLAKNPEQRLQSAKDLALELREIVEEFDSLSPSGTSATLAHAAVATRRGLRVPPLAIALVAVVAAAAVGFGIWGLRRGGPSGGASIDQLRITTITSSGDVSSAVVSPDGRYVAYTTGPPTERNLLIRQVATGSDVTVLAASPDSPRGLSFSPDGNYLYYLGRDPESPNYSALFQVASLGGTPVKRLFDVDRAVSFSPDGREACFVRGEPQTQSSGLYIWDVASGRERKVVSVKEPANILVSDPAWSPDGSRIAVVRAEPFPDGQNRIRPVLFRVKDGGEEALPETPWPAILGAVWLRDGSGLVLAGIDVQSSLTTQLGIQPYPRGRFRRVTNDMSAYQGASVAAGDTLLTAIRTQRIANLWTAALGGSMTQRTFASSGEQSVLGLGGLAGIPNAPAIYGLRKDGRTLLVAQDAAGGPPREITQPPGFPAEARIGRDVVVYRQVDDQTFRATLEACDFSGGNRRRISDGPIQTLGAVSPDGTQAIVSFDDKPGELWVVPLQGGAPRLFAKGQGAIGFSKDGSHLGIVVWAKEGERTVSRLVVLSFPDAKELGALTIETGVTDPAELPGEGIVYGRNVGGRSEVRRWRIGQSAAETLFPWSDGLIQGIRVSPDGSKLLVLAREGQTANLWTCGPRGEKRARLTDFRTGTVFQAEWAPDGNSVYFTYGSIASDVVSIRNFK